MRENFPHFERTITNHLDRETSEKSCDQPSPKSAAGSLKTLARARCAGEKC
jgi:hypothetical protein